MKRTKDPHIEAAQRARVERDAAVKILRDITAERDQLRAHAPAHALSAFSTNDLLAEIVRRRREEAATNRPDRFCDDCMHFIPKPDANDRYNPCQKGHVMAFWMDPEDNSPNPDCGFHRAACEDRA